MANYATLKAAIDQVIKANGQQDITGPVMNQVLKAIVDGVGAGYNFAGVATPQTNPGSPDGSCFWIGGKGSYTNFGASTVNVLSGYLGIFMWDGSAFTSSVLKIGGSGGAFDVTDYTGQQYATLTAALAAVPVGERSGGMSVMYVDSTDGQYKQARFLLNTFTAAQFTSAANWQGMDKWPSAESKNFVESGGVFDAVSAAYDIKDIAFLEKGKFVSSSDGTINSNANYNCSPLVNISEVNCIIFNIGTSGNVNTLSFYDENGAYISGTGPTTFGTVVTVNKTSFPEGAAFIRFCERPSESVSSLAQIMVKSSDDLVEQNVTFSYTGKFIKYSDGDFGSNADYASSTKISVENIEKALVNIGVNGAAASVAFYDDSEEFISAIGELTMSDKNYLASEEFPDGTAYIAFCKRLSLSSGGYVTLYKNKTNTILDELDKLDSNLDELDSNSNTFDITAYYDGTTYTDLSAALTALDGVPSEHKRGGMILKFAQTNNKYVFWYCKSKTYSSSVSDWEKINNVSLSQNSETATIEINGISCEVAKAPVSATYTIKDIAFLERGKFVNSTNGSLNSNSGYNSTPLVDITGVDTIRYNIGTSGNVNTLSFYDENGDYISGTGPTTFGTLITVKKTNFPVNSAFIRFCERPSESAGSVAQIIVKDSDDIIQQDVPFTYNGKYINYSNGELVSNANFASTAKISIEGVEKVLVNIGVDGTVASVAFYNENKEFISAIGESTMSDKNYLASEEFPAGTKYIAFCKRTSLSTGGYVTLFINKTKQVSAEESKEELVLFDYDSRYINMTTGMLLAGEFMSTSKFDIDGIERILLNVGTDGAATSIAYYDIDKNYISGIGNTTMSESNYIESSDFPTNAKFIAFCKRKSISVGGYVKIYRKASYVKSSNQWKNLIVTAYGDSVTATCNGNFTSPYSNNNISQNWMLKTAIKKEMAKAYGRGVGSQMFQWGSAGGSLVYINPNGNYNSRDSNHNYDEYLANPSAFNVPEGCICTRGSLSSWDRITKMYPSSIKDSIDVVLVMCHNDAVGTASFTEDIAFVENSVIDKEWSESTQYSTIGGDYNIQSSIKGAIASTIMKLQVWMPNAVIVLMTPISGRGASGALNLNLTDENMQKLAEAVREVHKIMSIPLIDMYATDGINGLNRTTYIYDSIHPYTNKGAQMLARSVIGGLNAIMPLDISYSLNI